MKLKKSIAENARPLSAEALKMLGKGREEIMRTELTLILLMWRIG
jgi:hypothetical protein